MLVVATDPLAGAGLAVALDELPGLNVVGRAAPDAGLVGLAELTNPEVLAVDVGMDGGVSALRTAAAVGAPVLALVPEEAGATDPLRAGALGVLHRESPEDAISAALHALATGQAVVDPTLPSSPLPAVAPDAPSLGSAAAGNLTERELQVLRLVADGLANKAIAARLGITDHTVKYHLNSVLSKLGAQNRTEAVTIATRLGLIVI